MVLRDAWKQLMLEVKGVVDPGLKRAIQASERAGGSDFRRGLYYLNQTSEYGRAAEYFKLAADKHHYEAALYLGELLESGRGIPKNEQEALRYYRWSAVACGRAKRKLADLLTRHAYQAGDNNAAKFELAKLKITGAGTVPNREEATELLFDAMHQRYLPALLFAADDISDHDGQGRLFQKDLEKAVVWYQAASDRGSHVAARRLGEIYELDDLPDSISRRHCPDEPSGLLYEEVESRNIENLTLAYGWYTVVGVRDTYDRAGVRRDELEKVLSNERIERAHKFAYDYLANLAVDAPTMLELGQALREGFALPQDKALCLDWIARASEFDDSSEATKALFILGVILARGEIAHGEPVNKNENHALLCFLVCRARGIEGMFVGFERSDCFIAYFDRALGRFKEEYGSLGEFDTDEEIKCLTSKMHDDQIADITNRSDEFLRTIAKKSELLEKVFDEGWSTHYTSKIYSVNQGILDQWLENMGDHHAV